MLADPVLTKTDAVRERRKLPACRCRYIEGFNRTRGGYDSTDCSIHGCTLKELEALVMERAGLSNP